MNGFIQNNQNQELKLFEVNINIITTYTLYLCEIRFKIIEY